MARKGHTFHEEGNTYNHLAVEYFVHNHQLIVKICRGPEVGKGVGAGFSLGGSLMGDF